MPRHVLPALRRLVAVLLLLTIVRPAAATSIGVTMVPPVAFFGLLKQAIQARAEAMPGMSVSFAFANDGDSATQIAQIRGFLKQKVDGLVVLPVDADAGTEIARLARDSATPLVFVNNGPRADYFPGRVALALPNDLVAGKLQMIKLASLMGGHGNLVVVRGPAGHAGAALRTQGVRETLAAYPDIHLIEEEAADWDRGKSEALVSGWLGRDHIDAIAANNDEMAIGAADAVAKAGKSGILIAGVDATPDGLAAMRQRRLAVTVFQDAKQEGTRAVDDVAAMIAGEKVPQYDWISFALVTGHTLARF